MPANPALQRVTGVMVRQAAVMAAGWRSRPLLVVVQAVMTRSVRMISPPATAASSQ